MICCKLVVDIDFLCLQALYLLILLLVLICAKGLIVCLAGDGPTQIIEFDCQVNLCIHYMPGHYQCCLKEDQELG